MVRGKNATQGTLGEKIEELEQEKPFVANDFVLGQIKPSYFSQYGSR
jgi:hypothetical protein